MNNSSTPEPQAPEMPSASGLMARVGIAAAIGLFLVVCVVMPAEYRVDPTGFGRMTGLLELSTPITDAAPQAGALPGGAVAGEDGYVLTEEEIALRTRPEDVEHLADPRLSSFYPNPWRTDTIEIPLEPDGQLEYKVSMKKGETMVYSWEADQGAVYYDFHGHPPDDPDAWQRYREVQETGAENGSLTAPMDGIHGWYFLNLTGEDQVITLKMSGFYELYGFIE